MNEKRLKKKSLKELLKWIAEKKRRTNQDSQRPILIVFKIGQIQKTSEQTTKIKLDNKK